MRNKFVTGIAAIALVISVTSYTYATSFPFEYDWTGALSGYGGKIFLDTSSNLSGSISDIDLANSYITTPDGTFIFANADVVPASLMGPFTWDSTQILTMDIQGVQTVGPNLTASWEAQANLISDSEFAFNEVPVGSSAETGFWMAASTLVAPVPDTGNAAVLFGGAVLLLVLASRIFRTRVMPTC